MKTIEDMLIENLVGKKLKHINPYGREMVIKVESVVAGSRTRQITPDTRENDWWGQTETTHFFVVTFIDGSKKEYSIGSKFDIVD